VIAVVWWFFFNFILKDPLLKFSLERMP